VSNSFLGFSGLSLNKCGRFRWVYCLLDILRRCFPASIPSILEGLPETLDETYGHILRRIDKVKRRFAHRLFQCIAVSVRPLRVEELAEILAVRFDAGVLPQFNTSWRLGDAEEAVLSACSSLIAIVNVDGTRIVQFAHFSVKEFLTSDRLATGGEDLSYYHVVPHLAHSILAQSSLSVLLQLDDRIDKDSITNFPLADYAARYWFVHGQFENVSLTIQRATERLFDRGKPYFAAWVWVHDIDDPWREPTPTTHPARPEAQPLYYAVLCGLPWLIEHLIATYPCGVDSRGGWHETPLLAALMTEDLDVASLLLQYGADVDVLDNEGWSPLHRASFYGRIDIVLFLLEHRADVNLPGHKHFTPLPLACTSGDLEISRLLLQNGADVNSRNENCLTPLMFVGKHLDLARLLIDNGADMNSVNNEGQTALHVAAHLDSLRIVKFLLESGADFNICDKDGQTPLDIATDKGNHDTAYILSSRVAAAMSLDSAINSTVTPSAIKRLNPSPKLVPPPQRSGKEANNPEKEQPSLYTASENGQLDIVRSLLDGGCNVNATYRNRMTALHAASSKGKLQVAKLLIERGADVDSRSRAGWTALHYALREGHVGFVRLLLDHGANANAKTRNDGNALHLVFFTHSKSALLEAIQLLLDHGADENVRNNRGRTPCQEMIKMGAPRPLASLRELLLDHHSGTCEAEA
jgi:ankyrin repeat protein